MKWLLTLIVGALLGAGSLFIYLRQFPHDAPGPAVVVAPSAAGAPVTGVTPGGTTPPGAQAQGTTAVTDLTEADLPLRPSANEIALPVLEKPAGAASNGASSAPAGINASINATTTGPGKLMIPVEGIKQAQLVDTYDQARGTERHHEALDIMAPKGTKVYAVADGKLVKLFNSKPGGLTVYQFDPTEKYAYYYAHLDRYADNLKEGAELKRGDLIGYVGVTGNSNPNGPHLHFAVFELTPAKQWWKGTPLNPYPLLAD